MNDERDLTLILKSRFPIVVIETHEEVRVLGLLERIANLEGWAMFAWSVADGLKRLHNTDSITGTNDFRDALRHTDKTRQNGLYVMLDAHSYLDDPINVRLLKEIAQGYEKTARTLVFVSHRLALPPELQRLAARFSLSMPDADKIRGVFKEEISLWDRHGGESIKAQKGIPEMLVRHLVGLSLEDARRLLRQAIRDDNAITQADLERVHKAKYDMLDQAGVVSLELETARFAEVAGQANLKRWLELRRDGFLGSAPDLVVEPPRGVLILGVQGGGKSLAAKAVAGSWGVPLMRLDVAALYDKFQGETERNLRESLRTAEAMSPCVLWMDEIEKGVATGGDGDGGVSRRVLGTLLTWMAERKSRVFMVATANDISQLPPELMRKGRFDEIFFVDLPDAAIRAEVFRIHLAKRKQDLARFDLPRLAELSEGFSGAEIEQAVVSGLYEAHARGEPLADGHVADEIGRTRPLSVVMGEQVQALRDWAAGRTVSAG